MINYLKNLFNLNKYKTHPEVVIITCYFNPANNQYLLKAFKKFYESIKHMNYYVEKDFVDPTQTENFS